MLREFLKRTTGVKSTVKEDDGINKAKYIVNSDGWKINVETGERSKFDTNQLILFHVDKSDKFVGTKKQKRMKIAKN